MNTSKPSDLSEIELMQILTSIVESENISSKRSFFDFFSQKKLKTITTKNNTDLINKIIQNPQHIHTIWDTYLTQKAICDTKENSPVPTLSLTLLESLSTFIINSVQGALTLQNLQHAPTFRSQSTNDSIKKIQTTVLPNLLDGFSFECTISQQTDSILFDWNIHSISDSSITLQSFIGSTLIESKIISLQEKQKYFCSRATFNVSLKQIQNISQKEQVVTFYVQSSSEKSLPIFQIPCTIE